MSTVEASVSVDVEVITEDRGDRWSGIIEETGTTVYGKDESEVLDRAKEMLGFIISSFHKNSDLSTFREYLDAHNIQHSIEIIPSRVEYSPARTKRYPLRYRPEVRFEYVA